MGHLLPPGRHGNRGESYQSITLHDYTMRSIEIYIESLKHLNDTPIKVLSIWNLFERKTHWKKTRKYREERSRKCPYSILCWRIVIIWWCRAEKWYLIPMCKTSNNHHVSPVCKSISLSKLTHWGRDKMAAISRTIFSNAFSWTEIYGFRLRFHWSLLLMLQLTIFQNWFR